MLVKLQGEKVTVRPIAGTRPRGQTEEEDQALANELLADEKECGLDVASLMETSAVLRDAIRTRPDLVVIEKFGDQEQMGEGLLDEIMQIITEGIPLLIAVPKPALDIWRRQCGGLGATLPYTQEAMRDWWHGLSKG